MTRPASPLTGGRLSSLAYGLLRERLLAGDYPAGERISLEALKTEFAVSKQPIMDAMRRLAEAGLVEIVPQVGCRVPYYSPAEVADFFTIFGGTEGAITAIAATRWAGTEVREIVEINTRIASLPAASDLSAVSKAYLDLNREFHSRIHRMSGSRIIAETSRRMWDMSDLLINTAGAPHPLAHAVAERAEDHSEICAALADRDAAAARSAMERHIRATIPIIYPDVEEAAANG